MWTFLIGSVASVALSVPGRGDAHKRADGHVTFVGCRSDGQQGPQRAPKWRRTPRLPSDVARRLAYYAANDGPGVLAPRGWHCFGLLGSNGSTLLVTPSDLSSGNFFKEHHFTTKGNGVELEYSFGGTSGRWAVAHAIARYFPKHRDFIHQNFQGLDVGPLPSGPYPHDIFLRRTDTLVRYTTPPLTKGAGTAWVLGPSARPVDGLSMLVNEQGDVDLLQVKVRLPVGYRELAPTILGNAEQEASQGR